MTTPPEPSATAASIIPQSEYDHLHVEVKRLRDRLALTETERDRLGVLDTVLKERRHHPDCPYKRECNCWLAAALTHRHDADLVSLALAEQQIAFERKLADAASNSVDQLTQRLALAEQALVAARLREDRLRAVVEAAQGLFGSRGERFGMIHHHDCQVRGSTVLGFDCDCGAQQVRSALARLDETTPK